MFREGDRCVADEFGLVPTDNGAAANTNDGIQGHGLLRGQGIVVFPSAGDQGAIKRAEDKGLEGRGLHFFAKA